MKRRVNCLVTFSLTVLVALTVLPLMVRGVDYTVGVKAGDWIKYGQFSVTWNGTGTEPSYVTAERRLQWARFDVLNVRGSTVNMNITLHFDNGTETPQNYTLDVGSGSMNGYFLIASNLKSGDPVFNRTGSPTINQTITATYAGFSRSVNMIEGTTTVGTETTTSRFYWDQATGIMVEYYMKTPDYENPGAYVESSLKATETNMWSSDLLGILSGNPIYVIVISVIVIIAVVAAVVVLRRKKPPASPPTQPSPEPTASPPPQSPPESRQ